MSTTISTEGWADAGARFRAMLRQHLLGLAATGRFDLVACRDAGLPAEGARPADASGGLVYRFGGADAELPPEPEMRSASFWPASRGSSGEGRLQPPSGGGRIVVPSRWSRERVIAAGAAPGRVSVVMPGVDGTAFSPLSRAERHAVRANLGLADDDIVLLHLGDGGGDSGIDLLLRAFARLRATGASLRLVLAADDADRPADYDAAVRRAAADEPGLFGRGGLDAVTTVPGRLAPSDLRLLYGAADALVSPDRAGGFAFPILEAIACGCPVVATRGGASDDICDDDLAWRISGAVRQEAGHGSWIEPDLDELTDALAEIALGRGFDRLRFAAARMRLLRRATWERSAQALADALVGPSGADDTRAPAPVVLHGMPQPIGTRFAAQPDRDLAARRRRARPRIVCPGPRDLSVVVQGPCLRKPVEPGAPSIDEAVASIRRSFPGAQVIVSTWLGSDIDGLDADDIVLSPDPGSLQHPMHLPNNVNRMVTSTANGLAAATRPFCIKTRNDVTYASDGLMRCPLRIAGADLSLERRIWTSAARLETSLRPFHPCDMVHFGLTADLRRLWDSPAAALDEVFLAEPHGHLPRLAAEQAVFVSYLRGLGQDPGLDHTFDGRSEIVAGSVRYMLGAFDVFDMEAIGVVLSPRFRDNVSRPRLYETHASFEELRSAFAHDPDAACEVVNRNCQTTVRHLLGRAEPVLT